MPTTGIGKLSMPCMLIYNNPLPFYLVTSKLYLRSTFVHYRLGTTMLAYFMLTKNTLIDFLYRDWSDLNHFRRCFKP